ncbi:hypothetical protein NA57DRAFT_29678 [Rhizodiscina lignyota]|uniref:Microtubule associated protein n=1 Tax=Rhizodiscina lignyota TaxID=1504668 RepID=A0A9P4IV80_9PEZI|nr:hypothetical protein NA57DRAFT_29678 [Rhizodiscina lignyota]
MDTSYLEQQVSTIIGKLHELFDEIGVPSHERDTRESELFSALSETLHNQLRLVANEKHEMAEEANNLITTIKQMQISLDGAKDDHSYHVDDEDLKVTYPLTQCLQALKEKHNVVSKLHRERYEQVRKLVEALESYSSHLEPSFVKLQLPPTSPGARISPTFDLSPKYVTALDNEFTRVYEEYMRRRDVVSALADEIVMLWAELGTPQAQTDNAIVEYGHEAPEQLGLHQDDVTRLKTRRDKLIDEKKGREKKLRDLRATIEDLWDRLGVEERDRRAFLSSNRGCGLRTINEFEDELARLNELKHQNLHLFVEDARFKLQELWDSLYFSEEEMLDFTPAFSDVYSDALLSAHETEIARLEALREQRAPILAMVDKYRSLIKDRDDLATSSQDASRLMARGQKGERRDPGKLLREEKMRKRIAKELPKVEADLRNVLDNWEDEYGRPFLVHGERYLDELDASSKKAPPPRCKTPNALNPPARPPTSMAKTVPTKTKDGSVRGPPPRSKTPTANPTPGTFSKSISASAGRTSPSKIPSRVPLSTMPNGNNSPERRAPPNSTVASGRDTIRKMGPPPPRAPPPKMKDLFIPPTPAASSHQNAQLERSGSIVRHVAPEDPYDDRHPTNLHHSRYGSVNSFHNYPEPVAAASRPESRQISGTSSVSAQSQGSGYTNPTTVSGSENWETYESASEVGDAEPDGADVYYAKLRASQYAQRVGGSGVLGKRPGTSYASPRLGPGKKMRGEEVMEVRGEDGRVELVAVRESEQSWEDEETY